MQMYVFDKLNGHTFKFHAVMLPFMCNGKTVFHDILQVQFLNVQTIYIIYPMSYKEN